MGSRVQKSRKEGTHEQILVRNASLVELCLDIGKHRARKDNVKLFPTVNKVKQKYNSLRQACQLANISWTKFHRHTCVKSEKTQKKDYKQKLSQEQIESIRQHYMSDDISFSLPDKKIPWQKIHAIQFLKKCINVQFVQQYNKENLSCYVSQV